MTTTTYFAFPEKFRQDAELPIGTVTTIANAEKAWLITQGKTQTLSAAEARSAVDALRRNPIIILKGRTDPSFSATWLKKASVAGVPVELVRVRMNESSTDVAIDASGRIIQVAFRTTRAGTGPEGTLVIRYADFRSTAGLNYPFSTTATFDGQPVSSAVLKALEVNPKLSTGLFVPPKG